MNLRYFQYLYFFPIAQRDLILQFVRREVLGRYRGSLLGIGWSFITPVLMLSVYTFVFVDVFKARWPGAESGGGVEFALQIFAGLIVFNLFAELVIRGPRLILEQPNLVKKVVFPLEILPWISVLAGLFHMLLSLFILVLVTAWARGTLPLTALALPLVILPFVPLMLGLSWLLAALGLFVRDVGLMMGVMVNLAMFMSPVFYSVRSLPEGVQVIMNANPLTLIIESLRQVLLLGLWPDWLALFWYWVAATLVAIVGAYFFEVTRKGFADVL